MRATETSSIGVRTGASFLLSFLPSFIRRLSGPLAAALPAFVLSLTMADDASASEVRYVRATGGSDSNDGTEWAVAFATLQRAIDDVPDGATIHVALGTYTPTELLDSMEPRSATFAIVEDKQLLILGGYPAAGDAFENRSPADFPTILTGDLAGNDVASIPSTQAENAFHVVYVEDCVDRAQVDGFVIQAGRAVESSSEPAIIARGGGILVLQTEPGKFCDPVIQNCVIRDNRAYRGGGVAIVAVGLNGDDEVPNPSIRTSSFLNNVAQRSGAGVSADLAHPEILGSLFESNDLTTTGFGGGVAINFAEGAPAPRLVNCTIVRNAASGGGGGVYLEGTGNSPVLIDSCAIVGNTASGGASGDFESQIFTNNVDLSLAFSAGPTFGSNPGPGNLNLTTAGMSTTFRFVPSDPENGDYRLRQGSPLLDAGNDDDGELPTDDYDANSNLLTTTELLPDRDLDERVRGAGPCAAPRVDIGAFERRFCLGDLNDDGMVDANDLALLVGAWGTANPLADLDCDEIVGSADLAILLGAWGDCDAGSSSAMSAQSASSPESLLGDLGFESVEAFTAWLAELEPSLAEQVVAILGILLEGGAS